MAERRNNNGAPTMVKTPAGSRSLRLAGRDFLHSRLRPRARWSAVEPDDKVLVFITDLMRSARTYVSLAIASHGAANASLVQDPSSTSQPPRDE